MNPSRFIGWCCSGIVGASVIVAYLSGNWWMVLTGFASALISTEFVSGHHDSSFIRKRYYALFQDAILVLVFLFPLFWK